MASLRQATRVEPWASGQNVLMALGLRGVSSPTTGNHR